MIYKIESYDENEEYVYYLQSEHNREITIKKIKFIADKLQEKYEKKGIDYDDDNLFTNVSSDPDCFHFIKTTTYPKDKLISLEEGLTWV